MLILQRKKEQALTIGNHTTITILEIGNDWVKLAIDAPKEVPVLRQELIEAASVNQEAVISLSGKSLTHMKEFMNNQKKS